MNYSTIYIYWADFVLILWLDNDIFGFCKVKEQFMKFKIVRNIFHGVCENTVCIIIGFSRYKKAGVVSILHDYIPVVNTQKYR